MTDPKLSNVYIYIYIYIIALDLPNFTMRYVLSS